MRSRWIVSMLAAGASVAGLGIAFAQAPTDARREAIRSACPADYRAHCATIPPGGLPVLRCLQKNVAKLSAACKAAVDAVGG